MNKKISLGMAIMLMAMTAAVAVSVTVVIIMQVLNNEIKDFSSRAQLYDKLAKVDELVREHYIGSINETVLNDDIVEGFMKGIGDRYGTYLDANEYSTLTLESEGKATGIGVSVVESSDGYIKVVSLLSGSPAEAAGVKVGDIITSVSGKDVKSLGYTSAVNLLKGSAGTTAVFTVLRNDEQISFSIVRKSYDTQTVKSRMIGNIGYVRIVEFDSTTASEFSIQVDNLIKNGAKALVFDVRNNPGGTLDSVEKMIDKLVPEGPIVRAKYNDGNIVTLATSDSNEVDLPMAVITNKNSASAAELFTTALKDYGKAKSVGVITYGKGTMQQIFSLNDGTALDLSVAYFYPPTSDNFEGVGVSPDIEVSLSTDKEVALFSSLSDSDDDQLQAALSYLSTLIS